jgi:monoterpene epsilon-lactone hydrolase
VAELARSMDVLLPEKTGRSAPHGILEQRAGLDRAIASGSWNHGYRVIEEMLGGCRVLRFAPDGECRGSVLHFHGGGFRIGAPELSAAFASALALRCGVEVVVPQYRLAPEYPFPAGHNDAFRSLQALREEIGSAPLIVSGDSAGGGLAALCATVSADRNLRIDGLILLSAWLDLTLTAAAYDINSASDPIFSRKSAEIAAELYLQGHDPSDPRVSPLFARLTEMHPPTLISVGRGEVLFEDSARYHARLAKIGVSVELNIFDDMEHVAVVRDMKLPGSEETFNRAAAFIAQRLDSL